MKLKRKGDIITILLIVLIIGTIWSIMYLKGRVNPDDDVLQCISSKNTTLYISKTCSHCAEQKKILGDGVKYFHMVDCFDQPLECSGILGVPTWEIQGEKYPGVRTVEELQELAGC